MDQEELQWQEFKNRGTEKERESSLQSGSRRKKRRRRKSRRPFFIIVLLLIGVVVIGSFAVVNRAPTKERKPVTEVGGIPLHVDFIAKDIPGRPGIRRKVKYIVIHETGNTGPNANAAAHNSYLHREAKVKAISWHYTVDDKEIYQHLPDTEVGFHAGDQLSKDGGNLNGIGVEMCVNPENDYEKTLKNTAVLVKFLMDAYHLDINDVKKHQDFSGKICPERLIKENRWDEFLGMVKQAKY